MYVVQTATVGSILKSVLGTYSTQYLFEIILFSDPPPPPILQAGPSTYEWNASSDFVFIINGSWSQDLGGGEGIEREGDGKTSPHG